MRIFRDVFPATVWVVFLLGGISFVYFNTEEKIPRFSVSPPFRQENFASQTSLQFLIDKDPTTAWKSHADPSREWDFSLELGLSHIWNKNQYAPAGWSKVKIQSCPSQSPQEARVLLFEREAINVDKELRMPEETQKEQFLVSLGPGTTSTLPLEKKTQSVSVFPSGISILGVKVKSEKDLCLSEIYLEP